MYKYMRTLKEHINESLLDDDILDDETALVEAFLEENYNGKFIISKSKNGKYIVDSEGSVMVKNRNITSLTNGLFEFDEIGWSFDCSYCKSLKSLKGAPRVVGGDFGCSYCDSLKDLKGAPREVYRDFSCSFCDSLKSLEGAPREIGRSFYCSGCESIQSLKGIPRKIGCDFLGIKCGVQFTKEDIKKVCNIKGTIYV